MNYFQIGGQTVPRATPAAGGVARRDRAQGEGAGAGAHRRGEDTAEDSRA